MVEAIACFFLISFPLAAWLAYAVAKRAYRPRPGDTSFLAKILSSNGQSFSAQRHGDASERAALSGQLQPIPVRSAEADVRPLNVQR